MRINKYLAECGLASRRKCEAFVTEGRVKVNGKLVTSLATEVDSRDTVTVDGEKVQPIKKHVYLIMNKPKGYVCTASDEFGRKTVLDLIKDKKERIFPVGRLDYDTEGLLLLTTDGDLANRLTHPRNEITKTYSAKVEGEVDEELIERLRGGVILDGVKTKKCKIKLVEFKDGLSRFEVVISEGRNRQVRRMFESINKEVVFLKRVAIGDLKLSGLNRGEYRALTPEEVNYLKLV
ncbi:MAG: rRNA pseudouridine synthase [Clostridiales bacterium]|nr:rRNA pseudouridine synthase [Clostridiales bacterium]